MDILTLVAIGVGLAMDAFAVSVAYGLSFDKRHHGDALKIAGAFGLFQAGMPVLGWLGGLALQGIIERFDHWVAFLLLAFIGGKMIHDSLKNEAPASLSTHLRTLGILALATSIDALAVGLLIAVLRVPLGLPVLLFGTITFVIAYAGIVGGFELKALLKNRGTRVVQGLGGLILVGIGVHILISHLWGM